MVPRRGNGVLEGVPQSRWPRILPTLLHDLRAAAYPPWPAEIAFTLLQAEEGAPVDEVWCRAGIGEATCQIAIDKPIQASEETIQD
jgi:hypothetical protein